ncbi:monovalent cation/H+ antiporter subunit D family protein [Paraglaciecola aquimarina]|uniref:Monovalent cation/H+ antiporter subunit D family protein n=1 Tax=Paraglaciecola aquimarina TaxID=1235557 RepID=A0ABU3SSL8_9ALTE|nr:monovalent cation/H+ antiporter subunit D family protein [Paraglaciecola aquimarina]MDU0353009.1 monovalent cation/H+ antiporter subunit D family protein [Paraglaciecola aquimarina]
MTPETAILVAIGLPIIGALVIALAGRIGPNIRETATAITAIALIFVVWGLLPTIMDGGRPAVEISEVMPGLSIAFSVEPLGMLFAALASGLWLINSIYSVGYMRGNKEKNQTRFFACFALALSATMGIAFAGNLFTLFLFYELLTLSTYPLVAHKGDAATVRSARIYLGVLISTSIGLFLPAIIWTYNIAGTGDFTSGGILAGKLNDPEIGLLLGLFAFGIGKAAVMPVHKWLPSAMVAPTPVSALLHAVAVVKAGVFAITKVIIYVFGIEFLFEASSSQWLLYAAAFTIIAASVVALKQTNIKRLLAYSTIAQLSYVVMASAMFKPLAELGASLHMVAHAFGKITLFFAAGAIYVASKKTEIAQLRGIGRRMPWTMAAFTIGALSMIGVPPTAGFVSKWYILAGAFEANNLVVVFTIIGSTALNAAYFLPILYMAWFEREKEGGKEHGEAPLLAVIALCLTALLTLGFFLFNGPVIELESQVIKGLG